MISISQKTRQTLEKKEKDQSGAVRETYLQSFDPDSGIEARTTNRLLLRFEFNITHCLDLDLNGKRPGVTSDGNFSSYLIGRS